MKHYKFQILIPQWNETDKDIKSLLDSIEVQQNIDFNEIGVIITNDGSDTKLSENLLNSYSFDIQYLQNQHSGVSATRNYCLDHSEADYVMFCDADDMFYNVCALWLLFREFNNSQFDSLISAFLEEVHLDNNEITYITHNIDSTFVHGKVYRRQYLMDNNIRFNPNLTIHEDSYFNYLAQHCTSPNNIKYCSIPFYLWKWRDTSVCRHDPKYILKTFNNMLDSSTALVKELLKRGRGEDAETIVTSMIYESYFNLNKEQWINQENKTYRNNTEKRFKQYYLDFKYLYDMIDENKKNQIIMSIKNRMFSEGLVMESITFTDWIKEVLTW
jgi:glycosyltransferase involved in cell wall biosynthesis